jgi:Ca-activated chloride channel family protein
MGSPRLFVPAVVLAVGLAVAGLPAAQPSATHQTPPPQDPQRPTFRTGVETVAIYASVLDEFGELITNLTEDDFVVLDDGKPQKLTLFAKTFQPITAALLVDTSASMALSYDQAAAAAEQFVIRLMPGDQARAGSFADKVRWATEMTGDRDTLLRGLRDSLDVGNPTNIWDSIEQTRTELASLGGRRVLVIFTDGNDTASRIQREHLLTNLKSDEIMVYVVQFPLARWPDPELALYQVALHKAPPAGQRPVRSLRQASSGVTEALQAIAFQTGGGHFQLQPFDDLNATFTQVTTELHQQYLLAFTPQRLDGRVHALELRAKRGATVRARRSYLAPKAEAPPR